LSNLKVIKKVLFDYNIFSKIYDVNQDLPLELLQAFATQNFEEIIEIISNINSNEVNGGSNNFFNEFVYFGHISLKEGNYIFLYY